MACVGRLPRYPGAGAGGGSHRHGGRMGISELGRVPGRGLPLAPPWAGAGLGAERDTVGSVPATQGPPPGPASFWEAAASASVWPLTGAVLTWGEGRTRAPCWDNALIKFPPSARWGGGGLAESVDLGPVSRVWRRALPPSSVCLLRLPLAGGLNPWMGWKLLCNRTTGSQPRFLGDTGKHGAGEPAEEAVDRGPEPAPGVS